MELKEFQLNAVKKLFEAMETPARDIILKSPTGSGKTIILTYFMHQYIQSFPKTVFVWLTPGKGNLEEQSKAKMDKYIHASQTKLLSDVMTAGFEENDSCFINWEKLTKKGNNALKDSERTNFLEHIEHALNDGLRFIIIVDESHQNNTIKADEIIQYFRTEKIIRCSATPKGIAKAEVIEIPEEEVIAAGLIKKMLVINQDFPQTVETEDQTAYLLERALQKQRELRAAYLQMDVDINPLIIVQIPNKSETLLDGVERWFEAQGLTYENGQLAVWLSDRHENLGGIDAPAAPSTAVIIKQAVATGWDCPRAQILVKLRDNMDETFEIQTIGRIRRMPEAKHYGSDLLDSCYLYTFDEKFGFRDYRGGGRSSGRETIGRVAAGAIAMKILKELGINITAYAKEIGGIGIDYDKFDIAHEDTLTHPQHLDDEPFEVIVSNPPYSIKWEGDDNPVLINDPRFSPAGVLAPKSKADLAFIMHSLAWLASNGTAAIVCFPGIMYRGGAEKKIRQYLIDNNFIDCIIQLPSNLFFGTSIATCIMVLKKGKADNKTLFIDASAECIKVTNNNKLTQANIERIVDTFANRAEEAHFSHLANYEEIADNDYNLSVSTYVEAEDTREKIDIVALNAKIEKIVAREQVLRDEIAKIIAEIEVG